MGYLLRLTELNYLSTPSWLLRAAGIKKYIHSNLSFVFKSDSGFPRLGQLVGLNESALSPLLYTSVNKAGKQIGDCFFMGALVPKYLIRLRYPKICPKCLEESGYARKQWELAAVTACPVHSRLLLDECPKCRKRITWTREALNLCPCGYHWLDSQPHGSSSSEIKVTRRIYELLDSQDVLRRVNQDRNDYHKYNPLLLLNLKHLLSALFFVASQYAGIMDTKGKHLAPSTRNAEMHILLNKAWSVFENWPDNYFDFLDWRREKVRSLKHTAGLLKDFSEYKSALYKQLSMKQLDFMRSSFDEYLATRWDGGYTAHLKRLSPMIKSRSRYVSRREAKVTLNIGAKEVDSLISAGKLKAVVRPRERTRLILIDRSSLIALERELEASIHLKQVESLLGISYKRVLDLIEHKILTPLRGPTVDGCSDWRFSEAEVKGVLAGIKKKIKPLRISRTDTPVEFLTALRRLSRIGVGMGKFIKAILNNEIFPRGISGRSGLASFLFSKKELCEYADYQRQVIFGDVLRPVDAARKLGVTRDVIYFFVRKGIIKRKTGTENITADLLIDKADLEAFDSTYLLSAKIAKALGTTPGYLANLFINIGIRPVSGPRVDGGRQFVFMKADVNKVDLMTMFPAAKIKESYPRTS